jgi:hypothetical protein
LVVVVGVAVTNGSLRVSGSIRLPRLVLVVANGGCPTS